MKNALVIIIALIFVSPSFAQETLNEKQKENFKKEDLTHSVLSQQVFSKEHEVKSNFQKNISAEGEKSLALGGVLSGILPGAGEFYAKSYIKAAIFLALEAGLWYGYSAYQKKGDDQEAFYKSFADANWNVRQYAQWIHDKVTGGANVNPNEPNLEVLRSQLNAVESQNFSHTLPGYGTQQYYELIGKYQNFVPGWRDADISIISGTVNYNDPNSWANYKTTMFINYSFDRQKANDYYDTSTRFISGVIINHVLSAADAVWSVSIYNKNLGVKTGVRIQERFGGQFMQKYSLPMANVSVQF